MKCIKAILRPDKEPDVIRDLEAAGISALTKWDVLGRGRQKGIQVGGSVYSELPKVCLLLVVEDEQADKAIDVIMASARTGYPGDGRIFVNAVQETYTIRTGRSDHASI